MPKDLKTNVIIQHQTKGFDKVRQDSDKLTYTLGKIRNSLTSLRKEYKDSAKAIQDVTKAIQEQMKAAEQSSRKQQQSMKQGAFTQGLLQGGAPIPSVFLQRGPGMGRQIAGMGVGSMLRSGAAGLGGSFTGVQGLQQFLSSIPIAGGLLAGQVGRLAGYSEQNLGFQRTKLEAAPYLSDTGNAIEMRKIQSQLSALRSKKKGSTKESALELAALQADAISKVEKAKNTSVIGKAIGAKPDEGILSTIAKGVGAFVKKGPAGFGYELGMEIAKKEHEVLKVQKEYTDNYIKLNKGIQKRLEVEKKEKPKLDAREKALMAQKRKLDPLAGLGFEGASLMGTNIDETTRILSQLVQAGGGVSTDKQAKDIRQTAFAAKTVFGIQAPTSGAFLKAGRRGGLVGGEGKADEAFKSAISEGLLLGLSGSEINQWMQQIAQGINQFTQTGIEINVNSISRLATDIGKAGLVGTRAVAMSQGISQYIQGIGSRGITSGADIMMLKELGGFKGGGTADFRKARAKLESMQFEAQGKGIKGIAGSAVGTALGKYMQTVGGDQAMQAEMLQRLLQGWGVKGRVEEFDWLAAQLSGKAPQGKQAIGVKSFAETQKKGAEAIANITSAGGITGMAVSTVSARAPNVKAMAQIQNQQIAIGGKMIGIVQQLERNAVKTTKAFSDLAEGPLKVTANAMGTLSGKAMEAADAFIKLIEASGVAGSISSFIQ